MSNPDATHPSKDRRPEPVVGASLPAGLQKVVDEATRTLWNQDGTPAAHYQKYQHYRGVYEVAVNDWIGSGYKSEIDAALDILASAGKAPVSLAASCR